ncbi:MAG: hypothetical protein JG777_2156 [Clostridia bacterium]|jgi:hypothetical protein|nr:hypothetical protein [Clostridia bacterium]
MGSIGKNSSIYYFNSTGRGNVKKTIEIVKKRCCKGDIKKVFVFAATKQSVYELNESLKDCGCKMFAVSFPYKQEFIVSKGENEAEEYIPETSRENIREEFRNNNIELIQGSMPFDEIVLPRINDAKIQTLTSTLGMISKGLVLCVQAIIMGCDSGYAEPGEDVIAMSADTAIVAKACQKRWLFHPEKGMNIKEILCKPLN